MRRPQHTPEGRDHLSIREVLDLLAQEFPDITISKIRFLESRGLIHPERTPSGYRKFYEADVERLAWILRQQREHFLPLKVIKGRLEQGGELAFVAGRLFETEAATAGPDAPAGRRAPAGDAARAPRRNGTVREEASSRTRDPEGQGGAAGHGPEPSASAPGRSATSGAPEEGSASLTADELAEAAGADRSLVTELESFGLIAGRDIAGVRCFGADALAVARLAAAFRRYGIEARHLRALKHAAERQASLIGQVVLPLLRQRNPESRRRALAEADELASLAIELEGVFLRRALGQVTGG
ncbi:MAG TPA: MerR family transcriptional regulator [Acidimicrobiales bacterium]|nr:MerR family transcriptional regulator [Acidimicrobiales bacterium]